MTNPKIPPAGIMVVSCSKILVMLILTVAKLLSRIILITHNLFSYRKING